MSQRDPTASLCDMLDYALKAVRFCERKTLDDLQQDEILQLAVARAVELIGEAAYRVPQETRRQHPDIPWQDIVATRHRLIHGYDRVDMQIIWDTIQGDLPALITAPRTIPGVQ